MERKQNINRDRTEADLETPEIRRDLLLSVEQKHN